MQDIHRAAPDVKWKVAHTHTQVHLLLEICYVELISAAGGISLTIRACRACETYVSKHARMW